MFNTISHERSHQLVSNIIVSHGTYLQLDAWLEDNLVGRARDFERRKKVRFTRRATRTLRTTLLHEAECSRFHEIIQRLAIVRGF